MSMQLESGGRRAAWLLIGAMLGLVAGGGAVCMAISGSPFPGVGLGMIAAMLVLAYVKYRQSKAPRSASARGTVSPAASMFASTLGLWMAFYVLAIVLISWVFNIEAWPQWARALAAITPALPIGGVIHALLHYVKTEPDEYQRLLLTRIVLIAMGQTFFLLTAWGFLELYVGAPHFPVSLAMTPFWLFFGLAQWWVRRGA